MKKRLLICFSFFLMIFVSCSYAEERKNTIKRISVEQARADVIAGKALFVCSYDDGRCSKMLLEGAILKSELEAKISRLSKDQQIIFYCG